MILNIKLLINNDMIRVIFIFEIIDDMVYLMV